MSAPRKWTRKWARETSTVEFRLTDGTVHGGTVSLTGPYEFSVVSHPRYGDTTPRRFRYEDVAEVLRAEPRRYVPLETFGRLMGGGR